MFFLLLIFLDKIEQHGTSYRAITLSLFSVCYGLISLQRQDMSGSRRGRIEELKERYARDQEIEGRGVRGQREGISREEREKKNEPGR